MDNDVYRIMGLSYGAAYEQRQKSIFSIYRKETNPIGLCSNSLLFFTKSYA